MILKNFVRDVADFPIPGVLFRDISPLLAAPSAFSAALTQMAAAVRLQSIDTIVGIESRGFILGAALAARHEKAFVPLRKAGKLPPPFESESYKLEYGEACLEMQPGRGRVLVVDDVLATGGTLQAALRLCERSGYTVIDVAVLIDLRFLNQFRFQGRPVASVLTYD